MRTEQNKEIVLAEHPKGIPTENTFKISAIDMPILKEDEVLLKSRYVSVDPGMRGFMDEEKDDAGGKKFQIGKLITAAYFGMLNVGLLKKNETVVVSGVFGAVGSIVVQIAKNNYK